MVPSLSTLPRKISFASWAGMPAAAATCARSWSTRWRGGESPEGEGGGGRVTEKVSPVVFLMPTVMLMGGGGRGLRQGYREVAAAF